MLRFNENKNCEATSGKHWQTPFDNAEAANKIQKLGYFANGARKLNAKTSGLPDRQIYKILAADINTIF